MLVSDGASLALQGREGQMSRSETMVSEGGRGEGVRKKVSG